MSRKMFGRGWFVVALIPVALLLASCGGSASQASSGGSTPSSPGNGGQQNATVRVVTNPKLGRILAGPNGHTLYLFTADRNGRSACSGACAETWPPLTTHGKPVAGRGVQPKRLGTIPRKGGVQQVTYDGHPLYYYAPDGKPGDVRGEGIASFGGEWYAVSPNGHPVENKGGSSGGYGGGSY